MYGHSFHGLAGSVTGTALAEGDAGTAQTIAAMRGLIDAGKRDPTIHELAARIIRGAGVAPFDWRGEVTALFAWVRGNVRFTRDVYGDEALHTAPEIVRLGIGDCDDFTVLLCSLLETVGHRTRIVTISSNASDPESFSHVFPEVELDGQWVPVDAGRKRAAVGKGPERYFRRREWDTTSSQYQDVQGMGAIGFDRAMGATTMNRSGLRGLAFAPLPAGLPGAQRAINRQAPQLRAAQRMLGLGHYGARAVRRNRFSGYGLGQDSTDTSGSGFDWSTFETELPSLITAGTTGTANIIKASNAPQVAAATNPFLNPAYASAYNAAGMSSLFANPTLLLIGGGLLLVMLMRSKD